MEDDIGERMAEHGIRLRRHDHLPVRSLVIFIRVGSTNYRWVG